MKRGVKRIIGKTEIAVNVWETYSVAEWYSDTPIQERNASEVKWAVYYLGGAQPEEILEKTEGVFRFQEPAVGKSYLIVAYVYEPELSTGLQVTVTSATEKKITTIRATGKSDTLSYGDTLDVVVQTSGMQNDYLELSLYEDDAAGSGHNSINNKNLLKTQTVRVGSQGVATTQFLLEPNFQRIANAYLARGNNSEGSTHEFYVAAYYLGSLKGDSNNINVANPQNSQLRREETTQVINGKQPQATGKVNNVQLTRNGAKKLLVTVNSTGLVGKTIRLKVKEEDYLSNDLLVDKNFVIKSDAYKIDVFLDRIPQNAGGGYWSEGNYQELFADVEVVETESHILSETIDVDISAFKVEIADNRTETVINDEESLLAAYFAKKEYVEKTNEEAGTYEYTFGGTKANNRTATTAQKEAVANAILNVGKVNDKLKPEKRYTTKEAIVEALAAEEYGRDTTSNKTVSFKTFKLGPKFIRVNSAPLEEKVYLVAETGSLNGKTVTIKIKEKDGIIKGAADAMLPVLEITEQQMETTTTSNEIQGTEKTQFTATVENGIAKVPIHLRSKSDEDLEKWKEKITKGKEDGNYTYIFGNDNGTIITAENKARIAGIIIDNAKGGKLGNPKIEDGKTAYKEDVETVLEVKTYNKGDTITFPTYKKGVEMLWLDVSCSGDKRQHQKEFLKEEGAYFTIGGCPRCGVLTIEELNQIFPDGTDNEKIALMNAFNEANDKFGLNSCKQKAHFFAQVREEVGVSINVSNGEGLNYAAEALPQHFSRFSTTGRLGGPPNDLAYQYGRSNRNGYVANEEMIANIAYANREGNGDVNSGDGWKYRGRGIIQVTFKQKYDRINDRIVSDYPDFGIEIDANNINNLREGTIASMSYWEEYGCQAEADKGVARENLDAVVDIVNSATPSRNARWEHLQNMINIFRVNECNGNEENSNWHHPLDRMELRGWYGSGFYPDSSDHGDASIRTSGHHDGLDLYAPIGTEVYACVDGEVYEDYISTTYGNTIGIKGEYNGNTYYFFYAHLSERDVEKGDLVTAGSKIGKTGNSGNASSQEAKMNHLHFEVRTTSARTGGKVDPIATITELGRDVVTNPDENTQTGN